MPAVFHKPGSSVHGLTDQSMITPHQERKGSVRDMAGLGQPDTQ